MKSTSEKQGRMRMEHKVKGSTRPYPDGPTEGQGKLLRARHVCEAEERPSFPFLSFSSPPSLSFIQ